jgi:hypothetical protein
MRPGRRFTKDEILRRREKVADLYCRRRTQIQIAEEVGVSQRQVSDDLEKVRAWWLESTLRNFDALKSEQLARLDQIEREAWAAWERSIGTHRVEKAEKRQSAQLGDTTIASVTKEERAGNPKFLELVGQCVSKRCEILGLAAPVKGPPPIPVNVVSARERLAGELARIRERQLPAMPEAELDAGIIEAEAETVQ